MLLNFLLLSSDLNVLPGAREAPEFFSLPQEIQSRFLYCLKNCRPCYCNSCSQEQRRRYYLTISYPNCRKLPSRNCISVASLFEHIFGFFSILPTARNR